MIENRNIFISYLMRIIINIFIQILYILNLIEYILFIYIFFAWLISLFS